MKRGPKTSKDPERESRDHILPVMWGGKNDIDGARNIKVVCQRCNERRAMCLHCVAIVACVEEVAHATDSSFDSIFRQWKLGYVSLAHEWRPPKAAAAMLKRRMEKADDMQRSEERRKANAATIDVARQVHRIGIDEFVYPADTPAKRVWNLVTLRRAYDGPVTA